MFPQSVILGIALLLQFVPDQSIPSLVLPVLAVNPRIISRHQSKTDFIIPKAHRRNFHRRHFSQNHHNTARRIFGDTTMDVEAQDTADMIANDVISQFSATEDLVSALDSILGDSNVGSNVLGGVGVGSRNPKLVVAHFMVGNTYPYTVDNWKRDIQLASASSIDGFALNIGRDDWMSARVADAYTAAQAVGSSFKLFFSFDMTSLPCGTLLDIQTLQSYVATYAAHPNQLLVNGKPLVSTFAGEGCSYGGDLASAWSHFKNGLGGNVFFVPSLFIDPARFGSLPFLDGAFNWNGGWPTQLREGSTAEEISQAIQNLNTDENFLSNLVGRSYIAPVSPWFFTHYGPNTWNKNWIYSADDWLYASRWEQLIRMRDSVSIVEIITWNDYGESHYIGPVDGAQPNSQAWVDGFDHQGWLQLTSYYAQAFKSGTYPTIARDTVILWARPHPRNALAPDSVPRPVGHDLTDDYFWAVVLAKEPATAILYTPLPGGDSTSQSEEIIIPAGISKLRFGLHAGSTMAIRLQRSGSTVLDYRADGFLFNPTPQVYNFNAWVGSKTN